GVVPLTNPAPAIMASMPQSAAKVLHRLNPGSGTRRGGAGDGGDGSGMLEVPVRLSGVSSLP
ncbi:MAG: hypothetical protein WBO67_09455, partial [Nitrospira sp.]